MADPKGNLLICLRDAYAMERHAEQMLRNQTTKLQPYAELRARIEVHLEETLAQQKSLANCVERIDGSGATLETFRDTFAGEVQADVDIGTTDEVVKDLVGLYAFKHLEIASYTSLIATAEFAGFFETKLACEAIVLQEIAMADWLLERLPELTRAYLTRSGSCI